MQFVVVCAIFCVFLMWFTRVSTEYFLQFFIVTNICTRGLWYFFLPCLRQVLQNMASLSDTSRSDGHKVSHFDWNCLSLLHAGLESVEGLLVSPDGPSNYFVSRIVAVVVGRLGV